MIDITCDVCNVRMKLKKIPEGVGKKFKMKCKGKDCSNLLTVTLKEESPSATPTIITSSKKLEAGTPVIQVEYQNEVMSYPLNKGANVIGRKDYDMHPDISLNVTDSSLSRLHCLIEGVEDKTGNKNYILLDYKSKNGVYLNGEKLSKFDQVYLEHNDEIYLSKTRLTFKTYLI